MFIFRIIIEFIISRKLKANSQYLGGTRNHWRLKQACTSWRCLLKGLIKTKGLLVLCRNCVFCYTRSAKIWILRYSLVICVPTFRGILLLPPTTTFNHHKEGSISFPWNVDNEHFFQTQGCKSKFETTSAVDTIILNVWLALPFRCNQPLSSADD